MKKNSILICLICLISTIHALSGQEMVGSPYTVFGIGDINTIGVGKYRALGGSGIGLRDGISLNSTNPASYTAISRPFTQLTQFGFDLSLANRTGYNLNVSSSDLSITGFNMWFRTGEKSAIAIGAVPYSRVSYSVNSKQTFSAVAGEYDVSYKGSGGLDKFYLGVGHQPLKNFSVGANFSYIFGPLKEEQGIAASAYNDDILIAKTLTLNTFNLDFGLQYTLPLNKSSITLGAIYDYKNKLNGSYEVQISQGETDTGEFIEEYLEDENDYFLPESYGFGISYKYRDKWLVTSDINTAKWSDANFTENYKLRNNNRYSFGFSVLPNPEAITYGQTIGFDFGLFYEQTYLVLDGSGIDKRGFSGGINLPTGSAIINLSYEYSRRKAISQQLIDEKYNKITISLTLLDIWFRKTRYE